MMFFLFLYYMTIPYKSFSNVFDTFYLTTFCTKVLENVKGSSVTSQLSVHLIKYPYRRRNCYCGKTIIRCLAYFLFCQRMFCLPFFYQLRINSFYDLFICCNYASIKSIYRLKLEYNCVLWHNIILRQMKIIALTI